MELRVNTRTMTITASGKSVEPNRFHDLPGHEGHTYIVRTSSPNKGFMVQIKQGKKVIQTGSIRPLSAVIGRYPGSDALTSHEFILELDPSQPIYPIADLVRQLMALGIEDWHISPMFRDDLRDCIASHSSPRVISDGRVDVDPRAGGGDLLAHNVYRVTGPSWVIQSFGSDISHIYLWMNAAEHADTILDNVRRIQAGETVPV